MQKKNYKRKRYFIEPSFQGRFIFRFCLVVIVSSILAGAIIIHLTSQSTTVAIENTKVTVKPTSDFILPILSLTFLGVTIVAALVALLLTLYSSHQIIGPIYRLQREIDLMKDGDLVRNFIIRESDQLQGLAHSLNLMTNKLRSRHLELKNACQSLFYFLEEKGYVLSPHERDAIKGLLDDIRHILDYFKV